MLHLGYLVLAATTVSAQDCHQHLIRDAKDAIETAFNQGEFPSDVKKEEWVREYVAKRNGGQWVVQRKDGSLNVYLDAKTGCMVRVKD